MVSCLEAYKYIALIPYYDNVVSIFWGCIALNYCWVCINAFFMMLFDLNGHIVIILLGMPVVSGVIYNVRTVRIKHFLLSDHSRLTNSIDSLNRIISIQKIIKAYTQKKDIMLTGIINTHILECEDAKCPCKYDVEIYDIAENKFSNRDIEYYKDPIFLKHFVKKLFEDSLTQFTDSPLLNVAYAIYLFRTMRHIHRALVELNNACRKEPSLKLQFIIYHERKFIEEYVKAESERANEAYDNLINITEFEELFNNFQQAIEKVTNYQIEFWSQVSNQLPDLNILNDFSTKIYKTTKDVEEYWNKLYKINPNYSKALQIYGNYMIEIKNHKQAGYELLKR